MIVFLCKLFDLADIPNTEGKILICSSTNVAGNFKRKFLENSNNIFLVDRVLTGLLHVQFSDFVRVGSLKKISKNVLPYSLQSMEGN